MGDNQTQEHEDPGWRHYHPIEVRFGDCDMFGHMNNASYLTYIETARVGFYTEVTGIKDPRQFGMTLAHAKIDFIKPIFLGQTINVYSRAGRIGTKSWTMEHELRDSATGELMATAHTVLVSYDYATGRSRHMPDDVIEKLERYEGRPLKHR